MNRLGLIGLGCTLGVVVACAGGGGSDTVEGDGGSGGATTTGGNGGNGSGASGGFVSVGGSGGSLEVFEVYGHGPNNLWKLDPTQNNLVTEVGPFENCTSGVLDIAIDKDNNIFGATSMALWSIDRATGACTQIASGSFPNSLSFVPAGTLDVNKEALVGYEVTDYVRIDPTTGTKQVVTPGALTGGLESSGDIVSVDGGVNGNRTYLTVRGTGCSSTDCLVEINPVTGSVVQNFGSVGYKDVFGLAFWGGSAFGFSRQGDLFEITFNGAMVSSQAISIPNAPSDLEFWGAGSSTLVPLLPPQ